VIIHSLRRELRAAGLPEDIIETTSESYALRREVVWVDSSVFELSVAEGKALQYQQQWDSALHRYEHARHLYEGDYLEEDVYADWCMVQREQLREIFLSLLAGMADCHGELGHYSEAAQVCRTALVFDPGCSCTLVHSAFPLAFAGPCPHYSHCLDLTRLIHHSLWRICPK